MSETKEINGVKTFNIAVLPGDGIGVDVTQAAVEVLQATESKLSALKLKFQECAVGAQEYLRNGDPLPEKAFEACRVSDAVLLGAMGLPSVRWPDGKEMTPQIDLREKLDLYGGIRPIYLYHTDDSPLKGYSDGGIDFIIVRENCEGLFSARLSKFDPKKDEVCDVMRISRKGTERVCRTAFELAQSRRGHCTLVDKANVLPSMVFFRSIFDEVAKDFPDVETNHVYVDAMALYLVQHPERFDVMVTENMFGDILSDLAAGLIGGMGMAPSGDIGDQYAIFQPSHGTAPDIAGKGIANPIACILSAAMMLDWLKHPEALQGAKLIRDAVKEVLKDPQNRTPDVDGQLTTSELSAKIINHL
ncbi:MAG: isocitrate/isopropylmalate dehydrogenase family protein [Verrucomicrobia bacterium]|jgi:3-isopropylmalate dehydrogenase|nr:isocitrate/isopropylmalate dehydrogenase family protein [Verrucomicrobiota bacterium]